MLRDATYCKHVTGTSQFVDDIKLPEMTYAGFARSPYAHARIGKIDFSALPPAIIAVLSGKDIDNYASPLPSYIYAKGEVNVPKWRCLASDTANFSGESVAAIVSTDKYSLEDALESVSIDYEVLPAVVDTNKALSPSSPLVHADLGTNLALSIRLEGGDVDDAFRNAEVKVEGEFRIHRHAPTPMEPRGIVASFEKNGKLTVWASTQIPFIMRSHLSQILKIKEDLIEVVTPDVGGGFGAKLQLPPEYVVVCILSILIGRPVKWVETRSESLASSPQAREQIHLAEAAFTKEGKLLAVRDRVNVDAGAYLDARISGQMLTGANALQGPYSTTAIKYEGRAVLTNKCPYGPYRGFGSETGAFVLERLLNLGAKKLGLNQLEIRRRNLIRANEQPFKTALGLSYDVADYSKALDRAVELSRYNEISEKHDTSIRDGKYIGIGLSFIIEPSSVNAYTGVSDPSEPSLSSDPVDFGTAHTKLESTGRLSIYIGTVSIGTGHALAIAQLASNELGLASTDVDVMEGNTSLTPYDCGVRASRFSPIVLAAVLKSLKIIRDRLAKAASHILGSNEADIMFKDGIVFAKPEPSKSMSIKKLVRLFYTDMNLLSQLEDPSLEVVSTYRPQKKGPFNAFSHTVHIPIVEVDAETGKVNVLSYFVIEDCGNMASPSAVDGQINGGITQAAGGIFLEEIKYSDEGQLLSNTFVDYLIPSALEAPVATIEHMSTPSSLYGGFKGMSESPNICAYPAIVNAIEEALASFDIEFNQTQLSPEEIQKRLALSNSESS